jgi:hypothetical protein
LLQQLGIVIDREGWAPMLGLLQRRMVVWIKDPIPAGCGKKNSKMSDYSVILA